MNLRRLQGVQTDTSMINSWLGYNSNYRTQDGEFSHMKNMTSDHFPLLSPRDQRCMVHEMTDCRGISASEYMCWADGTEFYYNNNYVCDLLDVPKHQFVQMGAYIVIFPDKIAYNTYTHEVFELESEYEAEGVTIQLCKMDGTVYTDDNLWVGTTPPEDKVQYPTWLDLSSTPSVIKIWSANESQWLSVPTTYVKMTSAGLGAQFKEDDAVLISGCDVEDFNTTMIVRAVTDNSIIVTGLMNGRIIENRSKMTFKRQVPEMDFVCEKNNRLYGCSSYNHEIYVSKLGDPTNWNYFAGSTADSYAATIGTDGNFTGCISHMGYVLFFKERGVHKLYGDTPSNFSLNWLELRGVQEGSEDSLVVLNEALFYKSTTGVCIYDGSLPQDISENFGTEMYFDAKAGGVNDKYYISMRDRLYNWTLFVYDTKLRMWHVEDNINPKGICDYDGAIYIVDQYDVMWSYPYASQETVLFPDMSWDDAYYYPSEEIFPDFAAGIVLEDDVVWDVETGDMGLDNPYQKYVSKLIMRVSMEEEAEITISIQYDSNGVWDELFNYLADCKKSFNIPLRVTRCDHYKLKINGVGNVKIYSLAQVIETGSEVTR